MDQLVRLDYMMNALSLWPEASIGKLIRGPHEKAVPLELFGIPSSPSTARGRVVIVTIGEGEEESIRSAMAEPVDGFILVADRVDPSMTSLLIRCAGVVTEIGGVTSHAAIVCREIGAACVTSVRDATKLLKYGDEIEVDGPSGKVKMINAGKR